MMKGAAQPSGAHGAASPARPGSAPGPRLTRDGEIRSTTIPNLFHELSVARATGLLVVTDGDIRKSIQLKKGLVLFASSNQRDDRLNQNLLKALEVMVATKDRLGEVLIRYKLMTPDDVEKYVRAQVCEIVYSTFQFT